MSFFFFKQKTAYEMRISDWSSDVCSSDLDIQNQIIEMALEADATNLSPRELAVRFTDEKRYFVSESTVYRLLKAHDLITSPAYVVIKAADQFHPKTTRPNELWQTDFTYFKLIGWRWMYLSTVLDDFSRSIIAWKLCTNMSAEDVNERQKRKEVGE